MKRMRRTAAVLAVFAAACLTAVVSAQESGQEAVQPETKMQDQVASAAEMVTPEEIVTDDMVPIYGNSLKDGVYEIEVLSSSSMFQIIHSELTVKDGVMTAAITLSGDGYLKLYMGTGVEAVEASEEDFITFDLDSDGRQTYLVPVSALDQGIACAAFSRRKEKWYDRTLVFSASSLPQDAFTETMITTVEQLGLEDGIYTVEVKLEGGSGKSRVESPAVMTVTDKRAAARIIFGSPHYDYVLVGEEKLTRANTEGNSAFDIPVNGFDWKMAVTADTLAMGEPHEIAYTLYFDSASIQPIE